MMGLALELGMRKEGVVGGEKRGTTPATPGPSGWSLSAQATAHKAFQATASP